MNKNYLAENMTMLCDFYELTMSNGYFKTDIKNRITYFDVFFRSIPDGGGFAIAAGLDQIIDYIENLKFTDTDIEYLRSRKIFSEEFLEYLKSFKFTGDIWAVPEGTPVFPGEPCITVRACPKHSHGKARGDPLRAALPNRREAPASYPREGRRPKGALPQGALSPRQVLQGEWQVPLPR